MNIQYLKKRFRHQRRITPGATNKKLSDILGVSERTVRRYFDLEDPAVPNILALVKAAEAFGVSLDAMIMPRQKVNGMPRDSGAQAFGTAVHNKLGIIWSTEDLQVKYVTPTYAKLFDTTASKMIGTNLIKDWASYADESYDWMPASEGHYRKPIVETLMAVAKDAGASTQSCWLLSPCGNMRRVLLRCIYMEDSTYLCIAIPLDDTSDPIVNVKGVNKDGKFHIKSGERYRSIDHVTVLHKFMSGWDIGRIADCLGWERNQVSKCLEEYRCDMRAEDLDQMRELVWEWAAEGKIWDTYATVRANGTALV